MSSPPIVGVPALCSWSGPMSRIIWPSLRAFRNRMKGGYSTMQSSSAVAIAAAARKLM
jgi:hypothetical protein